MHATTSRYFAFVSKFVDAVTTSALDEALTRAVEMRRAQRQAEREQRLAMPAVARAA